MHRLSAIPAEESEGEYRTIETALSETARGRWFLAEHGRRARRLDSALLDDAIVRLQDSLRQPPALLGQLRSELEGLSAELRSIRVGLLARTAPAVATARDAAPHNLLKAAENVHDIAWSLQANPFDPEGCREIARNASHLYVLSQAQAVESGRIKEFADALDRMSARVDAVLETVQHELTVDTAGIAR